MNEVEAAAPAAQTAAAPKRTRRAFLYNGTRLADPDPKLTVAQVKEYYTKQFPELINARIVAHEGGTIETETARREQWHFEQGVPEKAKPAGGAVETHEFQRTVKTKG